MSRAGDDDHKERIKCTFGLGGGELEDTTLTARGPRGGEHTYAYWYEGVPDYLEHKYRDGTYFTVISVGDDPKELIRNRIVWTKVREIIGPQEVECWLDGENDTDEDCPLCGEGPGEEHGHIYWGEPWVETIYRRGKLENVVVVRERLTRKRRNKKKPLLPKFSLPGKPRILVPRGKSR